MAIKVRNGNGVKNGNGHRKANGNHVVLKSAVLVFAVLLLAVLSWRQYQRWRGPTEVVWVAATSLASGSVLSGDDLEPARLRSKALPRGVLDQSTDPTGQRLARPKREGEPLTAADLTAGDDGDRERPSLAELLPAGRVLMRVSVSLEDVLMRQLRRGDRLDLLATGARGKARVVASDAYLLAWVNPALANPNRRNGANGDGAQNGNGRDERQGLLESLISSSSTSQRRRGTAINETTRMLLALKPEDVLPIASAEAAGELALALHGQKEVQEGKLLTLDGRTWDIEYINGAKRGSLAFTQ